jgi:hypothetical protein
MKTRFVLIVLAAALAFLPLATDAAPVPTNLELWLRADAGVTSSGGFVSNWADQSGNARDFSQPTVGLQPTVGGDPAFNGLPVITFDGVNDVLANASQIVGGNAFTVFTVAKISPVSAPYPWVFGTGIGARIGYEGPPSPAGPPAPNAFDVFHDFSNDARATLTNISDGTAKILAISGSGNMSSVQVWADGVPAAMSLIGADTAISFSPGNTLGFAAACAGNCFSNVTFAEILLYDSALGTEDRMANEAYLFGKYFAAPGAVPEPSTLGLLGLGAVSIFGWARRQRRRQAADD